MIDLAPPPKLWLPPKPAIIRSDEYRRSILPREAVLPGMFGPLGGIAPVTAAPPDVALGQIRSRTSGAYSLSFTVGLEEATRRVGLIISANLLSTAVAPNWGSPTINGGATTKIQQSSATLSVFSYWTVVFLSNSYVPTGSSVTIAGSLSYTGGQNISLAAFAVTRTANVNPSTDATDINASTGSRSINITDALPNKIAMLHGWAVAASPGSWSGGVTEVDTDTSGGTYNYYNKVAKHTNPTTVGLGSAISLYGAVWETI